ncbi:hypothetical protein NA57DRAFT_64745 [Rhizodiscina lignyota]|uniref:Uncharacterized protein n=1 Tax=Rhizodiscina lignyota TaxID=1504668 RepID=A0A9P4IMY0_9PEZI|nr:hypothetical protein NA57DRAFT_64745 [Rhizodiscina lignyota]
MDVDTSVQGLFNSLRTSLEDAATTLPTEESITPPNDGISLLDVKNELFISYLHNLVFLILLKTRHAPSSQKPLVEDSYLSDEVVKQLVELRVYLEKGVKPLEGRLKYQIDKVIRAADDASRSTTQTKAEPAIKPRKHNAHHNDDEGSERSDSGSAMSVDSEDIDELSYRPNPAAFVRPSTNVQRTSTSAPENNGIYKPPRIAPTAMPTTIRKEEREARRPQKSAVLDEFINSELSTAPIAEPSIGSTIVSGGRRMKSQREREEDAERQSYEETNFIRLPKESKKERADKAGRDRGGFGGEDWRNIDVGLDRIDRLTAKKGGKAGRLASSRKRAVEDSPRDSGVRAGEMVAKRRRMDMPKSRR